MSAQSPRFALCYKIRVSMTPLWLVGFKSGPQNLGRKPHHFLVSSTKYTCKGMCWASVAQGLATIQQPVFSQPGVVEPSPFRRLWRPGGSTTQTWWFSDCLLASNLTFTPLLTLHSCVDFSSYWHESSSQITKTITLAIPRVLGGVWQGVAAN